jgi:hypothetical protein
MNAGVHPNSAAVPTSSYTVGSGAARSDRPLRVSSGSET